MLIIDKLLAQWVFRIGSYQQLLRREFIMHSSDQKPQGGSCQSYCLVNNCGLRTFLFLLTLVVLLVSGQGKETVLLSYLPSKNDRILLGMLRETNYLFPIRKIIKGKRFECLSIVKNELIRNKVWKYVPIEYSINYIDQVFYEASFISGELFDDHDKFLNFRLMKVLSPLNGICVYYRTTTFLTEYCHKQHVRQYDDDYTKYYNQKPAYEDFNLGKFHENINFNAKAESANNQQPPQNTAPQLSDFSSKYQHVFLHQTAEGLDFVEVEEDQEGKLVHANAPIVSTSSYLQEFPLFAAIQCKQDASDLIAHNIALVVNPFEAVYTKKEGSCLENGQLRVFNASISYDHMEEVRVYREFMFGKVEEVCTKKANWQRSGRPFEYSRLTSGSTLFIQFYDVKTNTTHERLVTIKKVHHSQLVELYEDIGSSIPLKRSTLFDNLDKTKEMVTELNRCELLFDRKLSKEHKSEDNRYVGSRIMMLNESILSGTETNRLGCICSLQKDATSTYEIDMDVTVGKKLWMNYYQVYFTTKQKIYLEKEFKDVIFRECKALTCHRYQKAIPSDPAQEKKQGFTQIIDLDSKNRLYNVSLEKGNNVYVANILKGGILRLVTIDSEGNQHVYLLSEGQFLKVREFENGTKQIEKENTFYQNATRYSDQSIYNSIYVYCFELPNGTYYGSIWKNREYLQFPRIRMLGERILFFQIRSGYGFIRKLDISRMKYPKALSLTSYPKILEEQYLWEERRKHHAEKGEQFNQLFLNRSYSINFTYSGGDYCGAPINKQRETIVTLKCGSPWYQIVEIRETKPCTYWIEVQTLLLCEQNFKVVVESDIDIPNKTELDKMIFSGVACMKEEGLYDEAYTLLYPGKKMFKSK